MADAQAAGFLALLDAQGFEGANERARVALVCATVHVQRGEVVAGLARCKAGLALEDDLSEPATAWGVAPMLHFLQAKLHALGGAPLEAAAPLDACARYGRKYSVYHLVSFKSATLRRELGLRLAEAYEQLNIAAAHSATLAILVRPPGECGEEDGGDEAAQASEAAAAVEDGAAQGQPTVKWDWSLAGYELDFSARFEPSGAGEPRAVAFTRRCASCDGPFEGSFTLPKEATGGGVLTLVWSNYFSYVRGKQLSYRIAMPRGTGEAPEPQLSRSGGPAAHLKRLAQLRRQAQGRAAGVEEVD